MTCLDRSNDAACCSVWPNAVRWNGTDAAAIGRFSCATVEAGAALLAQVLAEFPAAVGPMDGDTWHSYRLVTQTDGSPPFFLEPGDRPVEAAAFQAAGFSPVARYASSRAELVHIRPGLRGRAAVTLRPFDLAESVRDLGIIHALSNRAFVGNAFFTPIAQAAFMALYAAILPRVVPDLVMIAEGDTGEPFGFIFGLPNYAEGPAPETVILKTYASLLPGLGGTLSQAFHAAARRLGFRHVIHALMHDDNLSLRHSTRIGGAVFRRYALFGRETGAA